MTVTTNDPSTLIRLAREGAIIDLSLTFSVRHWTFMYEIKTNL